mgnify:CR=1 FL=1
MRLIQNFREGRTFGQMLGQHLPEEIKSRDDAAVGQRIDDVCTLPFGVDQVVVAQRF